MRVGTLCFATDSGLGILAKSFYDHGVVTDVMVVRHGRHPTHDEWYTDGCRGQITDLKSNVQRSLAQDFCRAMDVVLFFETPFHWPLITYCREKGVKTVLMPMYECMPEKLPELPDVMLCPSLLDLDYYPDKNPYLQTYDGYPRAYFLPVPVEVPWRQRERARVFVHNAGHGGLKGRNGTAELLQALEFVQAPINLILRSQGGISKSYRSVKGPIRNLPSWVEIREGTTPYNHLWDEGDVFIFPEKFNGLSLPLQEARAAGMLVMATDRFPNNRWLPTTMPDGSNPLIPTRGSRTNRIGPPYNEFQEAIVDPRDIAAAIDAMYDKDISTYSLSGKKWAEETSWEALKPRYLEILTP